MKFSTKIANFINKVILLLFAAFLITIFSCGNDFTVQPKGDYISGYAIFIDTNYIRAGGYYAAALYSASHPSGSPISINRIDMSGLNPHYYRVSYNGEGNYYGAIIWVHEPNPQNSHPMILGVYGCDTSQTCGNSQPIAMPNFTGANYNIICWADTSHSLWR